MLLLKSKIIMRTLKSIPHAKQTKLFETAEGQHGFFTAKQATHAGFLPTNHPYYVKAGLWIKEERGIYRLAHFPRTERWDLVLYSLWSRDRSDQPQGVYSLETALSIYELSDVSPSKLHMTVPQTFRKSAKTPGVLRLHFGEIPPSDIETKQGFRVTKPFRTVLDLIEEKGTSLEFIEQALVEGISRGLITMGELRSRKVPVDIRTAVERTLSKTRKVSGA
jgi:predicted transcriptional regulator of viral defense system